MHSFGDRIKQIRLNKGMSQQEMADFLGTSKQVISRYETSQRTPKITIANEYAQKLGVALNFLLGEDGTSAEAENDFPNNDEDIRRIHRAREAMSNEDKAKMMRILEASFEDYFGNDQK